MNQTKQNQSREKAINSKLSKKENVQTQLPFCG
jgi:hypothetical protein